MDSQTLQTLAVLLALGAGFVAPTKAVVDVFKRTLPDLPPWCLLVTALVAGELLVLLVSIYGGLTPTPQNIAGLILAGGVAAGGAVASTELHKAARAENAVPTVDEIADELERRRDEHDQADWMPPAPPAPPADSNFYRELGQR